MSSVNQKTALDASLVNTVVNATTEVLTTMAGIPVAFKEVRAQENYRPMGDISAVIGIIGQSGEGMIALSFSHKLASYIVAQLLGTEPAKLSADDRVDGVGELVNMISGNAKSSLSHADGEVYKLTLPTVVQGSDHSISTGPKNCPYLVVVFDTEGETFNLQVSFKSH